MSELSFYGASDDCVIIDITGEPSEEFYLGTDNTWTATIQDTDGNTAQLKASFCVDNPDGWHVEVTDEYGECPWPKTTGTVPDSPEEDDPIITLTVPRGIVIQEDQ